jgi:hypothetical protein
MKILQGKKGLQICFFQVKRMKNFASGSAIQVVESSNITFGRHQETTSTEGTSSWEGEPSSTRMRLREKKKIDYSESPIEADSSGSEYQEKLKKVTYTNVFQLLYNYS